MLGYIFQCQYAQKQSLHHKNMIENILSQVLESVFDASAIWTLLQILWKMCKITSNYQSKRKSKC